MMEQQNTPGGPIRWKLHVPAPPENVFHALDSDAGYVDQ